MMIWQRDRLELIKEIAEKSTSCEIRCIELSQELQEMKATYQEVDKAYLNLSQELNQTRSILVDTRHTLTNGSTAFEQTKELVEKIEKRLFYNNDRPSITTDLDLTKKALAENRVAIADLRIHVDKLNGDLEKQIRETSSDISHNISKIRDSLEQRSNTVLTARMGLITGVLAATIAALPPALTWIHATLPSYASSTTSQLNAAKSTNTSNTQGSTHSVGTPDTTITIKTHPNATSAPTASESKDSARSLNAAPSSR